MDRSEILRWLEAHPAAVHGEASEILERCEHAVRRHAAEDAWLAAKSWAERRRRDFESHGWGNHASEAFVAGEVCHQLAWELRHHEPEVAAGAEEHLAGGPVREALEPDGWAVLSGWVLELAREQEHATWREVVRFTDRRARSLVRERQLSRDQSLENARHYPEIAADVAGLLARDYSVHAHPR
jgi:hypothetical protein